MKVGVDKQDRAQILALSDQLKPDLATPPSGGEGVCARCSTWIGKDQSHGDWAGCGKVDLYCENCVEARDAFDREPLALSVISLYRKPSPLRDALTRYKGRDNDEDPFDPNCAALIRSMLGRYLLDHGDRLIEMATGIDGIVVVPSTVRPPPHPLEQLVDSLALALPRWSMLERGSGELGFRRPSREGYRLIMDRQPSRILLLDDVYTTGSRLNSAAWTLDGAGHRTVAALVLARRINPDYSADAHALWRTATDEEFDWTNSPRTVAS